VSDFDGLFKGTAFLLSLSFHSYDVTSVTGTALSLMFYISMEKSHIWRGLTGCKSDGYDKNKAETNTWDGITW
jgi:hypothetical protein